MINSGRLAAAAALVVVGTAVTGCGSAVAGHGGARATGAAVTSAPVSSVSNASGSAASDFGPILERIALQQKDFKAGYTVQLMPGGDEVVGQVTLDNCGYDFTTEAARVARRQYELLEGGQDTGLSNELVAYSSPADAAKALQEWIAAAAHCPHTPVRSSVEGVPELLIKVKTNDVDDTALPVPSSVITVESATAAGQGTIYNAAVLQVHDRYLDAVYLQSDQPETDEDLTALIQFATITGERLLTFG